LRRPQPRTGNAFKAYLGLLAIGTRMSRYFVIGAADWYALPTLSLMAG
jgi:hypothetical protein